MVYGLGTLPLAVTRKKNQRALEGRGITISGVSSEFFSKAHAILMSQNNFTDQIRDFVRDVLRMLGFVMA